MYDFVNQVNNTNSTHRWSTIYSKLLKVKLAFLHQIILIIKSGSANILLIIDAINAAIRIIHLHPD